MGINKIFYKSNTFFAIVSWFFLMFVFSNVSKFEIILKKATNSLMNRPLWSNENTPPKRKSA